MPEPTTTERAREMVTVSQAPQGGKGVVRLEICGHTSWVGLPDAIEKIADDVRASITAALDEQREQIARGVADRECARQWACKPDNLCDGCKIAADIRRGDS